MDKEKIKQIFHPLFNKISNICIAAGSNRELLKEAELKEISSEELNSRVSHLVEVLAKIEENANSLNKALEELYMILAGEKKP